MQNKNDKLNFGSDYGSLTHHIIQVKKYTVGLQ